MQVPIKLFISFTLPRITGHQDYEQKLIKILPCFSNLATCIVTVNNKNANAKVKVITPSKVSTNHQSCTFPVPTKVSRNRAKTIGDSPNFSQMRLLTNRFKILADLEPESLFDQRGGGQWGAALEGHCCPVT